MRKREMSDNKKEACPDCGRYVGPVSKCPYCGSTTSVAAVLRYLRIISVSLVIFGLFFLFMMVRNRGAKLITVSDITPAMNYAAIRVNGRVMRAPYIIRKKGVVKYMSFELDDGSGTLRVYARNKVAAVIACSDDILPHKGDVVEVSGKLTVKDGRNIRLEILSSDKLKKL